MCPRRWFYTPISRVLHPAAGRGGIRTHPMQGVCLWLIPPGWGRSVHHGPGLGGEACSERWAGLGPQRDCIILGRGLPGVLLMSDRLELQAECACVAIGVAQLAPGRRAGRQSGKRRSGMYSGRTRQTPATPPRDPTARPHCPGIKAPTSDRGTARESGP